MATHTQFRLATKQRISLVDLRNEVRQVLLIEEAAMGADMYVDYVVDETLRRKTNNELLDPDNGEPNPELAHPAECALAEVAVVLHRPEAVATNKSDEVKCRIGSR